MKKYLTGALCLVIGSSTKGWVHVSLLREFDSHEIWVDETQRIWGPQETEFSFPFGKLVFLGGALTGILTWDEVFKEWNRLFTLLKPGMETISEVSRRVRKNGGKGVSRKRRK